MNIFRTFLFILSGLLMLQACKNPQPTTAPTAGPVEAAEVSASEETPASEKTSSSLPAINTVAIVEQIIEEPINFPQADREFRAAWVATVANIN